MTNDDSVIQCNTKPKVQKITWNYLNQELDTSVMDIIDINKGYKYDINE